MRHFFSLHFEFFPTGCSRKMLKPYLIICSVLYVNLFNLPQNALAKDEVKVSCRDEQGQDVDWYYLYKLPKHYISNSLESDTSGFQYLYITSRSYQQWTLSSKHIDERDSIPAVTLDPLFADPTLLVIGYNDEFPNGTTYMTGGHSKGVVATDGTTGIWLIHSVPKFPSIPTYEYPSTGAHYGQSFLCLTLAAEEMHKVGQQLIFNEPNIYYTRLPVMLDGKYPNLEAAMQQQWRTTAPFNNVEDLVTLAGKKFKSFAKGVRFEQELYEDWLAPTLDVNLLVETWRNGAGNMDSNCSRSDKVYNIAKVEERKLQISFKTSYDHSKWAVSQATGLKLWRWRIGGADWICVGDINRQNHQLVRGGGTVCQKHAKVTKLYRDLVSSYEPCSK